MTEKLQQIILEELNKLPSETREAVNSLNWISVTEEVGKSHLLDDEEVESLQVEVLLGLIGIADADTFVANIEDNVGTSKEEAGKIADEVGEKIFYPIIKKTEEIVVSNLGSKRPNLSQNVSFILSGGNYSEFLDKPGRGSSI